MKSILLSIASSLILMQAGIAQQIKIENIEQLTELEKMDKLMDAVGDDDQEGVINLIKKGVRVNFPYKSDQPLIEASRLGHTEIAGILIKAGADVNGKNDLEATPLMQASYYNNTNVISLLIKAGANVNARDHFNETALLKAVSKNNMEAVRLLIKAGADINDRNSDKIALIEASSSGNTGLVKILLEAKADVNLTNRYGESAFHTAAEKGDAEILKLLLDAGANKTIFSYALISASHHGYTEIVRLLIQRGADVNYRRSKEGACAIDFAAPNFYDKIVKLLIDAGAVMDPANGEDSSALMDTISRTDEKGRRHTGTVLLMLKAGANPNATNEFGESALMFSFYYDDEGIELTKALLEYGADPNYKSKDRSTALQCARVRDCKRIVKLLKKYGAKE